MDHDDIFQFTVGDCDPSFKVNLSNHDLIIESLGTHHKVIHVKSCRYEIVESLKTIRYKGAIHKKTLLLGTVSRSNVAHKNTLETLLSAKGNNDASKINTISCFVFK